MDAMTSPQRTFLVSTTQKPGAPAGLWGKPPARSWDAHGAWVGKVEMKSTEACRRSAGAVSSKSAMRAHAAPCLVDDALRDELLLDLLGARVADAQLRL